jgi:hypothetical protein
MSSTYVQIDITDVNKLYYDLTFTIESPYDIRVYVDSIQQLLVMEAPEGEEAPEYPPLSFFVSDNNSRINLTSPPPANSVLTMKRETNSQARIVDFQAGAVLTEKDLDDAFDQVFAIAQESKDIAEAGVYRDVDGKMDAQGRSIKNVAFGTEDNDAVTKHQIDVEYPKIEVVADNISGINTVATDLDLTTSAIETVSADLNLGVASKTKTVSDNITTVQVVGEATYKDEVGIVANSTYKGQVETVADDLNLGVSSNLAIVSEGMGSIKDVAEVLPEVLENIEATSQLSISRDANELLSVDAAGKMVWVSAPDNITLNGGYF